MAFGAVTQICAANNKAGADPWAPTTTGAVGAGDVVVVAIACDNTATADGDSTTVGTVTLDGQTLTKAVEHTSTVGVAADGVTLWVGYLQAADAISSGAAFSIPHAATAKAVIAVTFTKGAGTTLAIDGTVIQIHDGADPPSMTGTGAQNVEHAWFRLLAVENVDSTFTASGTWTGLTMAATVGSSNATNVSVYGEYRIADGTDSTASDPATTSDASERLSYLFGLIEAAGGATTPDAPAVGTVVAGVLSAAVPYINGATNGTTTINHNLRYRVDGGDPVVVQNIGLTSPYTLTGQVAGTSIDVAVQTVAQDGVDEVLSDWSAYSNAVEILVPVPAYTISDGGPVRLRGAVRTRGGGRVMGAQRVLGATRSRGVT